MQRELLELASELARRGEPFVLAVVVARQPPVSSQVGDVALITRDGAFHGWVGGSCSRPTVTAEAKHALEDGQPRLLVLGPDAKTSARPGTLVFPMTCHSGGSVEIHLQPVMPRPRLLIYGMSPTARALSRLAQAMSYDVYACDESADASAFPGATRVVTNPSELTLERGTAPLFAVVATHGDWDEVGVLAALAHDPEYLGVVASPKRFAALRTFVTEQAPQASFAKVHNPAGIDIGARGPEEIALSILAEIVRERRAAKKAESAAERDASPRRVRLAQAPAPATARDPVCGMSVTIEGARFRGAHDGREYFFCCGGCRDRFLANPERYLAAGAGA